MTEESDGRRRPFLVGWRVLALNVLSASTVVTALSAALTGSLTTEVVRTAPAAASAAALAPPPAAAPTVVVLGGAPLRLPWPAAGGAAYVDLVSGSGATAAVAVAVAAAGVPHSVGVYACTAAWTADGACRTGPRQLPAGRLEVAPGQVAHLRLGTQAVEPAQASIVVALGTGALTAS
jgi:hypothetical protein